MLLLNIVDASVLQRITPLPPTSTPHPSAAGGGNFPPFPASAPPPSNNYSQPPSTYPGQGQQQSYRPAPPPVTDPRFAQGRAPPPPAPPAAPPIPPHALAQLEMLPEDQRTMLMQVLQMTPDQISALDANQQASVLQLVSRGGRLAG